MITILHGDDIVKSRNELETLKQQLKAAEVLSLDGKKIDLNLLKQALETNPMFTLKRLLIIENISQNKNLAEVVESLEDVPSSVELILWEDKEVNKSFLKRLPKARVLLFKPEAVLFKFLESIKPGGQQEMLSLLLRGIRVESPEIVFYMLVRQFRFLILLKDGVNSGVEELDRLADWQKQRLVRQTKYFSLNELFDIYHQLLEIDYQQKTGQATFDLAKTLELFIMNL